jgi:hypothetical protein
MALVIEQPVASFDLSQVKRGDLLWARHFTWDEGKAGFVTSAVENQLIVQYHPGIGNVTNHFIIPISEAVAGKWEIRWSADLTEVQSYNVGADEEQEGGDPDDSGGAD